MEKEKQLTKSYIYTVCAIAAINNCNLGYDIGIVSGVGPLLLRQDLFLVDNLRLELFIGALDVASLLGAFSSNYLADRFGRKGCMALSEVLFIVSVLGMAVAQDYLTLVLFRCVCGIAVGLGLTIGPLYIGEIAPDAIRGKLISWSELATNTGLLVAFAVGYAFSGMGPNTSWRLMLALGSLLPGVLLCCLYFMPESPRWLLVQEREQEALEVLKQVYDDDTDTQQMVYDIQDGIAREAGDFQEGGWSAILHPTTPVFYALLAGVGIAAIQQLSGIEAITSYFLFIFDEAEVDSSSQYMYLVLFGLSKLVTVYFAAQFFDDPNVGRRSLLLVSGVGVCVSMLLFLIVFSNPVSAFTKGLLVFTMFFYVIAYSVGYGPGAWVVMLEVLPMQIRAKGLSVTNVVNRSIATILSSSFLSMAGGLGYSGYFLFFTVVTAGCVLYIFFLIPETQGLSLEQVSSVFQGKSLTPVCRSENGEAEAEGEADGEGWGKGTHLRSAGRSLLPSSSPASPASLSSPSHGGIFGALNPMHREGTREGRDSGNLARIDGFGDSV
mmetsp:Transcript_6059/g.13396  ORF Transcript_6059/g.13396 Transcript_6059/m.13396 type:complete len:551 (-) Transcript_6059:1230-2882(-)